MAKFNIKQTAIKHVEKAVFAIVIIVVLIGLAGADWSPYQGTPGEIVQKVVTGEAALVGHHWPVEEQQEFQDIETTKVVQSTLYANVDLAPWEMSDRIYKLATGSDEPVTEPVLMVPESIIADSSRAFLLMADTEEEAEESTAEELAMTTEEEADNRFGDELAAPNPNAATSNSGGTGGGYGADYGNMGASMSYAELAGDLGGYGSGSGYGADYGDMGATMGYEGSYGAGGVGATLPERNGQGYSYVSVRAVFPLHDQIKAFAKATNSSIAMAAMRFKILDFELQRQMLLPDGQNWTEWDSVDINVAYDVLEKVAGFEQDVISSAITNPVITMPLPMRISGRWDATATHERIKNFELSKEEMALEQEIMSSMLKKLADEKKQLNEGRTKPKGFNDFSFGFNNVASDMMDYGGGGGGYNMMGMMGGGGYGASGYGAGGGAGYAGGGGAGYNPGASYGGSRAGGASRAPASFQSFVDALAKGKKNEDELKTEINDWLKEKLTAAGQLILFRYFDFGVEPGKTYQYRVRFILENPNYLKRISEAGGMAHVVEGETRATPWSEPTTPVRVKDQLTYFLTEVSSPRNTRILPTARVDVYQWDPKFGTMVSEKIEVQPGQSVASTKDTEVIDLAKQKMEKQKYTFSSNIYLIDAMEDLRIDSNFHSGENIDESLRLDLPRGYSDRLRNDVMVLVRNSDGRMERVNQAGGSSDHKFMEEYMTKQKEIYSYLDQSQVAATEVGGGYGDNYGDMGAMSGMFGDMGMGSRSKSAASKKRSGGSSAAGGRSSGGGSRGMAPPTGAGMSGAPSSRGSRGMAPPR